MIYCYFKVHNGLGMICTLHLNLLCENAFSKYKSQNYKSFKWEGGEKVAPEICKKKKKFFFCYSMNSFKVIIIHTCFPTIHLSYN